MNIEELLKTLNITKIGSYSKNNNYIIDINDSNEFGRIYSTLDTNDELDESDDATNINEHTANIVYKYENQFQLTLIADWDNDTYKLVIEEI